MIFRNKKFCSFGLVLFFLLFVFFAHSYAVELAGSYSLIKDSDGTTPLKNASVVITFKGKNSGSISLLAERPGEVVEDIGKYSINGKLITITFNEMEWEAKKKPFVFDGCTLTLPFKALSGSPGPGTSAWIKNDAGCSGKDTNSLTQDKASNLMSDDLDKKAAQNEKIDKDSDNNKALKDDKSSTDNENSKETCEQCKYIKCIKSFIKLREAYIKEFQKAATEKNWGNIEKEGEDFFDLSALISPEAKKEAIDEFNKQRVDFWSEFRTRIDRKLVEDVKKNCRIDVTGSLTAKTDPLFCQIDESSMKEVEKALPCKELYEASRIHESYHKTRCMERAEKLKENKGPFIPTARGEVKEDMEAYAQQIKILKVLLEKITKTKNGCWRCGKTQEIYPDKKECNINCPNVRLGGNIMFKCFKINTPDGEHVMKIGDQF
ncbi:MAG: hypothetical protein LLF28_03480 [Nitrospiraceae bacterium]|nr:hypothetical protein [Nitrospiraceae bacterium]